MELADDILLKEKRKFDIVIYDASHPIGFYLAKHFSKKYAADSLKWAIAGDNIEELVKVKNHLISKNEQLKDLYIIVGDSECYKKLS